MMRLCFIAWIGCAALATGARADGPIPDPPPTLFNPPLPPVPIWPPWPAQSRFATVEVRAELQNVFRYMNHSDFDSSEPLYSPHGRSVGELATLFRPRVTLHVLGSLHITYEVEIGLNFWSRGNPDDPDPLSQGFFLMKHRELFAEGEFSHVGFKVGYARYRDPTGLFLDHWMGIAQLWHSGTRSRTGVFVGQVPDQIYDGVTIDQNNFKRDIWVFGARSDHAPTDHLRVSAGLTTLVDTHLVDQTRWVLTPSLHVEGASGGLSGFVDGVLQLGQEQSQIAGGQQALWLAWAAQAGLSYDWERFGLRFTALALSPDDPYEGNSRQLAFCYSGKSRSATLMLTEDEMRDWYDNLDERASRFQGGFFVNRAGLFVGDAVATFRFHPRFRQYLIAGAGTVLQPKNAADGVLVGVETDLMLEFIVNRWLVAHVVVGGLFPGAAGSALINQISPIAGDPILLTEASLLTRY
jgi:hypothetical protein